MGVPHTLPPIPLGYRLLALVARLRAYRVGGVPPCLPFTRASGLPKLPTGGEQFHLVAVAGTISVVTGRAAIVRIGRISWQQQRQQLNQV